MVTSNEICLPGVDGNRRRTRVIVQRIAIFMMHLPARRNRSVVGLPYLAVQAFDAPPVIAHMGLVVDLV